MVYFEKYSANYILIVIFVLSILFLKDACVKAYDLETEPTKSLHADPRYPFYVHTIFRFYQYSSDEITYIERSALEMTLNTIADVKNVSGSADVTEISSVVSFNPKGDKGGKGASTTIETKVYVTDVSSGHKFKFKINSYRDDRTPIEELFKKSIVIINNNPNKTYTVPDGFYIYIYTRATIVSNQDENRHYWHLLISSIFSALIGSFVITSQALRRYDFNPLNEPTQAVDQGKYEYVLDDDSEEKKA